MTSSSSPGISLMMEGLSYIAGARLPCLIVNVMRGGPGLGNIAPSQGDYFQACKGGGHGDYHSIVLAPWNVQEMYELTRKAFDIADRYRMPVIVLADAQGKEVRVAKDSIDQKNTSQLSLMPANVVDQIPEADFYSLLAYLLSQRGTPGGKAP